MKAQLASKSQLLSIMSKKQHELEGRLDDMLSRIAKETQEIKDLEQQLTEGERHCSDIGMIISKTLCLLQSACRGTFYIMWVVLHPSALC